VVNLRYIDWIWQIRGSLALAEGQSSEEAFSRLDPLFDQPGTTHERTESRLTFRKKDPLAQDKMSIFDGGTLEIEKTESGAVLRYWLNSRFLLFCFVLPLFFLAMSRVTLFVAADQKPTAAELAKEEAKKKNKPEPKLHWLDKALGAPEPEKKDKTKDDKAKDDKAKDEKAKDDKAKGDKAEKDKGAKDKKKEEESKITPTPSYAFAGIFALLYVVGRLLEDWLIKRRFRQRLQGA
jgi:hypothetical protein